MSRTYGKVWFRDGRWNLEFTALHAREHFRRLVPKAGKGHGIIQIRSTEETSLDIHWFMQRYALEIRSDDLQVLKDAVKAKKARDEWISDVQAPDYVPRQFSLSKPPRKYQAVGAEIWLAQRGLLCGDDLGLGKTVTAITGLTDPNTLPAVVVVPPNLQSHWMEKLAEFVPNLYAHQVKQSRVYELPKNREGRTPDVLVISYAKLNDWVSFLKKYVSSVVYDECQHLRRDDSLKYKAARSLSSVADYRLGLSATTIANYGGEMFNVIDCLVPGGLGDRSEFYATWCPRSFDNKHIVSDPVALGDYLRTEGFMIDRKLKDVGRELPKANWIYHHIESHVGELDKVSGSASELAEIILGRAHAVTRDQQRSAAMQLDTILRQATGIAKANAVAKYVEMLLDSGEPVLLFGHHHAVYEIWKKELAEFNPQFFTGRESPKMKQESKRKFIEGESDLLIMALRSGEGVDGLERRCRVAVFGELDWTWAMHNQCIGRLRRNEQTDQVVAYFMISDEGIDPEMCEILGVKEAQLKGLRGEVRDLVPVRRIDRMDALRKVAERYLSKRQAGVKA
ncbi:hypothetical protein KOR42_23850 [Thalassoglobus neptunius]|uniref:Helicase ATP-binding domain-containing protein n=1 Tax=Thalassoglobus neptunius TaxID=1938619 RepID=A0A5C5X842_9PLAN|nr:DEAD/DEAH box helicase [Thalassoglobus neptunius]TWT58998.1 hypothetical protein KOR42_23850 [Thalassoglobus neptunius]